MLCTRASAQDKPAQVFLFVDTDKSAVALDVPAQACAFAGSLKPNDIVGAWPIADAATKHLFTPLVLDAKSGKASVAPLCKAKATAAKRDVSAALETALGYFLEVESTKMVVLVDAGGHDMGDKATVFADGGAISQLHSAQIPVYTVAVGPAADKDLLAQIAAKTGGRAFEAADAAGLPKAFADLAARIDAARGGAPIFEEPAPPDPKKPEAKKPGKPEPDKAEPDKKPESKPEEGADKPPEAKKPEAKKPEAKKDKPKREPTKKPKKPVVEEDEEDEPDEDASSSKDAEEDVPPPPSGFMKPWMWYLVYGLSGLVFWVIVIKLFLSWRRRRSEAVEEEEEAPQDGFDPDAFFKGGGKGGGGDSDGGGGGGRAAGPSKRPAAPAPVVKARFVPMGGGGESFEIASDKEVTTLGRKAQNNIVFTHPGCSGFHAELRWEGGVLKVVDKGSTNGTFVNDEKVKERALKPQDVLRFDALAYRVGGQTVVPRPALDEDDGSGGSEKTAAFDANDPMYTGLTNEEPEATTMLSKDLVDDIEAALNCSKHKNRVAQQRCELCSRPYCSECLARQQGQYLCQKCRAVPGA